ncbi:MAG: hypothetical protein ACR2KP_17295 [Egibacteraceae bacterium]
MASTQAQGQAGAAVVALAPAVLLVAFVVHPFIAVLPDAQAVAVAVEADTTRWGIAHLLTGVGSALIGLAFLAVRAHLRDAGEERFSPWGLPFVIFASALYGILPGLEFAPMAAAQTGGDIVAVQGALEPWFMPVFVTGAITFAIGVFAFARGVADSRILSRQTTRTVVTALAVMATARAVPLGIVQFYLQALAGLVALWPLAHAMWPRPQSQAVAPTRRHPSPAT